MWYVYILECEDGRLYAGTTQNVKRRFREHMSGNGGYFTGSHRPKRIAYFEDVESEHLAKRRELQIKRWSRPKKQALIQGNLQRLRELSVSRD